MLGKILIGNAPVSWGIYGGGFGPAPLYTYQQILDEINQAGYHGTELGPYGFYPTDASTLRRELETRSLQLASSFVSLDLQNPANYEAGCQEVLRIGQLLKEFKVPYIIVAAAWATERGQIAGFVPDDGSASWSDETWSVAARRLNELGRQLMLKLGQTLVFHAHTGTWVETPWELDRLLELTDSELVGVCLDTGHLVYGGGDPVDTIQRWPDRVRYIHFKDVWPDRLGRVRQEQLNADAAWQLGVFSELGQGCVDFPTVMKALSNINYSGWIVVEQDVLAVGSDHSPERTPLESAQLSYRFIQELLKETP